MQQIKGPRKQSSKDLGIPVAVLNLGKARAGVKRWIELVLYRMV